MLSESPDQIKNAIEKETGLKISIKVNSISSSMRGYITFSTKKQKGAFTEWSFEYQQKLNGRFEALEPHPTFVNKYRLDIYFGDEAYNYVKKKSKKAFEPKQKSHVKGMFIPKGMRDANHFIGWTFNYGRPKGVKGSVMGTAPNVVHSVYELNIDNLNLYSKNSRYVYLGNGEKYYK